MSSETAIEAALKEARVVDAVAITKDLVRKQPARADLRSRLFQLFCLTGEWQSARTQLELLAQLDDANADLLQAVPMLFSLLAAEKQRIEVFTGRQSPPVLGEPPAWLGYQLEGLRLFAAGQRPAAIELFQSALSQASTSAGSLDQAPFNWIMDADCRFGPAFEVVVGSTYYWLPFSRVAKIDFPVREGLHERVWLAASLTLTTGGTVQASLPVRYPGTEALKDGERLLARATEWEPVGGDLVIGTGGKWWTTDVGDYSLLKIRQLEIQPGTDLVPLD